LAAVSLAAAIRAAANPGFLTLCLTECAVDANVFDAITDAAAPSLKGLHLWMCDPSGGKSGGKSGGLSASVAAMVAACTNLSWLALDFFDRASPVFDAALLDNLPAHLLVLWLSQGFGDGNARAAVLHRFVEPGVRDRLAELKVCVLYADTRGKSSVPLLPLS